MLDSKGLNLSHVMLYPHISTLCSWVFHGISMFFLWFLLFHSSEFHQAMKKPCRGAPDLQAARGKVPPWHPSRLAPKTQREPEPEPGAR